jgi:hypothetical protein
MKRLAILDRGAGHPVHRVTSLGGLRRAVIAAVTLGVIGSTMAVTPVAASTATVTTLDVPDGQQHGAFTVTAHVRPAPQYASGFIPAIGFLVDGNLSGVAPLDLNGDGSTELMLPPGTYSVIASFGGFEAWDPSASEAASVTVGIATAIDLNFSLNPALDSQPVTINAAVTPESGALSGGTLSIVDAFDGTTIASGVLSPSTNGLSVTRTFAAGEHPLTATYTGHEAYGPASASLPLSIEADTLVDASNLGVNYPTFYPVVDGYRDAQFIHGRLNEPASVEALIYSPGGSLIKTLSLGLRDPGDYGITWDGRDAAGKILPAGTYQVVQRLTDRVANVKEAAFSVGLSHKKLDWTSARVSLNGSQFSAAGHGGTGFISLAKSSYARGVQISSGSRWASVRYSFTLQKGVAYSNLTFRVLGRSPNGREVFAGLWNPSYGTSLEAGNYDGKLIGPSYDWWAVTLPSSNHRHRRAVHGEVLALKNAGYIRKFDIAKVQLNYRWAVLV